MQRGRLLLGLSLAALLAPAADSAGGQPSDALSPTKRIRLFNGSDLSGFSTWLVDTQRDDPRRVFTVTNGAIRISGDGLGYLSTTQAYRDYRLVAEFKWGARNWAWGNRLGAARDSGVFLHGVGPDGNSYDGQGAFKAAIECNVFQGATGDFLLIRGTDADGSLIAPRLTAEIAATRDADGWPFWQPGGRRETIVRWGRLNWRNKDPGWKDVLDFRGSRDVEKPYGRWNRLECICDGDRIRILLNGTLVNEAFDVWPRSGRILLQCEGSEIYFRKLELHPLPRKKDL
jgi:hypothetical protein